MTAISYSELLPDALGKTFQAKSPSIVVYPRGTLVSLLGERDGETWIDRTDSQTLYSFVGVIEGHNPDTGQYNVVREGAAFILGIETVTVPTRLYLDVDGAPTINRNGSGVLIGSATGQLTGQPPVNADLTGPMSTVSHADYNNADTSLKQRVDLDMVVLQDELNSGIESVRQLAEAAQLTAEAANANAETRLTKASFEAYKAQITNSLNNMNATLTQHTDQLRNLTARVAFLEDTKIGTLEFTASVDSGYRKIYVSGKVVDIPEENPVRFLVTDSAGASATGEIAHNGSEFNGEVLISDLAPGTVTVQAQTEDRYKFEGDTSGNIVTASLEDEFENIRGTVSIDELNVHQGFRTVNGSGTSVDTPDGSIQVIAKDKNNKEVIGTGTVTNGVWSFDNLNIHELAFGNVTITVGILDIWGFIIPASVVREFKLYTGSITLNAEHDTLTGPVLDATGNVTESTEGSPVVITAWNTDNVSVTVTAGGETDADGNYRINDLNIFDLGYGTIRTKAVTTDRFGNDVEKLSAVNYQYVALPISLVLKRASNPHYLDVRVDKDNDLGNYKLELLSNTDTVLETVEMQASEVTHTFNLQPFGPGNYRVKATVIDPYQRTIEAVSVYTYVIPPRITVTRREVDNANRQIGLTFNTEYIPTGARLRTVVTTEEDTNWSSIKTHSLAQGYENTKQITIPAHPSEAGKHRVGLAVVDSSDELLMIELFEDVTVLDVTGAITDMHCNDNDVAKTVIVSGKIRNKKPGTPVRLLLTGSNGATINRSEGMSFEATGPITFAFDPVSIASMPYGNITALMTYTDMYGDSISKLSNFVLDNLEGGIDSVSFSVDSANARVSFSGTSHNVAPGSSVTYSLVDRNGKKVQGNASVGATGNFSANNVSIGTLAYGSVRLELSVVDLGQTTRTASRTSTFTQPGSISVTASINDAAKTINVRPSVARIKSNLTITLRDSQGKTDSWTVSNSSTNTTRNISGLRYGTITVTVSGTDNNGSTVSATASDRFDAVNGSISVTSAPVAQDGKISAITGTTSNIPAGTRVNVTLYRNNTSSGAHRTNYSTTVASNGSWRITGAGAPAYGFDTYIVAAEVTDLTGTKRTDQYRFTYSDTRATMTGIEISPVDTTRIRAVIRSSNRNGAWTVRGKWLSDSNQNLGSAGSFTLRSNTESVYVNAPSEYNGKLKLRLEGDIPGGARSRFSNVITHQGNITVERALVTGQSAGQVLGHTGRLDVWLANCPSGSYNLLAVLRKSGSNVSAPRNLTLNGKAMANNKACNVFDCDWDAIAQGDDGYSIRVYGTYGGVSVDSTIDLTLDSSVTDFLNKSSGNRPAVEYHIDGSKNDTPVVLIVEPTRVYDSSTGKQLTYSAGVATALAINEDPEYGWNRETVASYLFSNDLTDMFQLSNPRVRGIDINSRIREYVHKIDAVCNVKVAYTDDCGQLVIVKAGTHRFNDYIINASSGSTDRPGHGGIGNEQVDR